jgi:hypothetical protein
MQERQKNRGDEIRLLANFPECKLFWENNYHKLECFTCQFSQDIKKDCDEPIKRMKWMMKRIKKDGKTHIITFCPACNSGDPWIIHGEMEYMMIQINMEHWNKIATQQKKGKTKEGWQNRPENVSYYRDSQCLVELYGKPIDWREQENEYDRKMMT